MTGGRAANALTQRIRWQAPRIALPWDEVAEPLPDTVDRSAADRPAVYAHGFKRGLDVLISLIALVIYAPVLALLVPIIMCTSRGPVFYHQSRIGIDRRWRSVPYLASGERRHVINPGRPFEILKLRTMRQDAETDGPRWATADDARVTGFGRFLRRSRLDEFPQFINVLRGEMSVVGPRPERLCFISRLENSVPGYRQRLEVRPGITGLAQVINGYDTDLESVCRKVRWDRRYIAAFGLRTDLWILALTVKVVLMGKGAH